MFPKDKCWQGTNFEQNQQGIFEDTDNAFHVDNAFRKVQLCD